MPRVWADLMAEAQAGRRRYAETALGDRYSRIIAFKGEGDYSPPGLADRTLGDLLHPYRPTRPTGLINAASTEINGDAAAWRFERIWLFAIGIQNRSRDAPEMPDP